MEMWVLALAVLCCYVGTFQACMPGLRYIPATPPSGDIKRFKNETDCGRKGGSGSYYKRNQDKIVGGSFALENEFPWQVALWYHIDGVSTGNGCGGFLLSCDPVIVVTAAHCVSANILLKPDLGVPIPLPAKMLKVALGAHTLDYEKLGKNEVRLDVEEIIIHPSFARYTIHAGVRQRNNINVTYWENDIAVLKVKTDPGFQCKKDSIWPACLPRKENDHAGYMGIVTGWGNIGGGNGKSKTLKKATVSIAGNEECGSNNQLCAIDRNEEGGPCGGDSGGPLVVKDAEEDAWSAVGIVSYGPTGCDPSQYEVYTRVGYYLEWISDQFGLLPPQ